MTKKRKLPYLLRSKIFLVALSATLSAISAIIAFEIYSRLSYEKWKKSIDDNPSMMLVTRESDNKTMIWDYKPNSERGNIKINRWGFRDIDYESQAKPDGVFRIACIGDSVTVGVGAEFNSIFTRVFEKELNSFQDLRKYQVLNIAIDGYHTIQVRELLFEKAIHFKPDQVIYCMCMNDFDFEDTASMKTRYFIKPKSFFMEKAAKVPRKIQEMAGMDYRQYFFEKYSPLVFDAILEMNEFCKNRGISFKVVIFPFSPAPEEFSNYKFVEMHSAISEFLSQHKIECTDMLSVLAESRISAKQLFKDKYHLYETGHEQVGRYLASEIIAAKKNNEE